MNSQELLLGLAILGSSFWGSWHCAAMCSPVACLMAQKRSLWIYHFGRGLSYIGMGAAGGYLGSFFLQNEFYQVRLYSGWFFACILLFTGIQILRGRRSFRSPGFRWVRALYRPQLPGLVLGLLSVFLPCGWLYSYILAAAATRSPESGALVMFLFWLGGLPALSSVSLFMGQSIRLAPSQKQTAAGLVLVCAALYSLASFYWL